METARNIMAALAAAGHEAYIVGGAVRDLLRGVPPVDIDIATSAVPERIAGIAEKQGWKAVMVGAAFGVVAVVAAGHSYEIATFRSERYGADSHRPESVELGVGLAQDLARRDFTINAMALAADGSVIDLFGGREDLAAGIIRAVGAPRERFAEDGLRMFRAARFAARFNFTLEAATFQAITDNLERVSGLSVERVRNELEKILLADFAAQGLDILLKAGLLAVCCQVRNQQQVQAVPILPELCHLDGLPQNPRYHLYDAWRHTLDVVGLAPCDPVLRWAALLHDIAKGWPGVRTVNGEGQPSDPGHDKVGAEAAAIILRRLRVERHTTERVVWLIRHHLIFPAVAEKAVLKWLKRMIGGFKSQDQFETALWQLFALHEADRLGGHTQPDCNGLYAVKEITRTILSEIPFFPEQLALSARDIAAKLGSGPEVGRFQQNLLLRIQAGQLLNEPVALTAALNARRQRLAKKQEECL
ncbi:MULTISPECIES: CCA tRNA nucleotidyltransferase [Sporomusa]|uniref:CCA tRNA nucleotidyltransferase n=1 Tax=Sporomusa TaxID=2375 RepID=UPI00166A7541|nr:MULTISPECIES: HD domain-containing protein [Sporomusa]MCM0759131.1 HD domain-containing protein [Sporomusa sphaeroides DSM 2875]